MAFAQEEIQQIQHLTNVMAEANDVNMKNMLAKQSATAVDIREMRTSMQEGMGRIDCLVGRVEELEADIMAMKSSTQENLRKFEERLKAMEANRAVNSGGPDLKRARSAGPTVGRNDKHERTVEVGGFAFLAVCARMSLRK